MNEPLEEYEYEDDGREPGALLVGMFWAVVLDCVIVTAAFGLVVLWHWVRHR